MRFRRAGKQRAPRDDKARLQVIPFRTSARNPFRMTSSSDSGATKTRKTGCETFPRIVKSSATAARFRAAFPFGVMKGVDLHAHFLPGLNLSDIAR